MFFYLPLYREIVKIIDSPKELYKGTPNLGLVYDKYFYEWSCDWKIPENGKQEFYIEIAQGNATTSEYYKDYLIDRINKLAKAQGLLTIQCKTSWRFVSGLGIAHPTENGFVWDRNLGVPILPGSSVKGMVRAWAEKWGAIEDQEAKNRIFGPPSDNEEHREGTVIFYDAYPTEVPNLDLDIMNVHYKDYYDNMGDAEGHPPADYLNPNPVFFLTVAPGTEFIFAIGPSSVGKRSYPGTFEKDVDTAVGLLTKALEVLGVGAKTAVGYGRFG